MTEHLGELHRTFGLFEKLCGTYVARGARTCFSRCERLISRLRTAAAVVELPLTQLFVFRFGLSASASAVSAGGECRTRSVGADFTSAVPRRCSQSSMPRAISRFT